MTEENSEYLIVGYVDELEMAMVHAGDNHFSEKVIRELDDIRGDFVELSPLLETEEDSKGLRETVGELLEGVLDGCREAKESVVVEKLGDLRSAVYNLKIKFGLEKAKELLNGNDYTMMCTSDESGKINVAIVGSASILDEEQLLVAHLALSRSAENLKQNKHAAFVGYKVIDEKNPMATKVARVYCTLNKQENEGPIFDFVKEGLVQELGDTAANMLRQIYLFKIDEIRISSMAQKA